MTKIIKTNVIREIESKNIFYNAFTYPADGSLSAAEVAEKIGKPESQVFKTLVTISKSKNINVFVVPANRELDLKAAANVAKEKSVSMLPLKDLFNKTGYVHGGCSPIAMKRSYNTFIDESANNYDSIIVSAGKIGIQIELKLEDLIKLTNAKLEEISK
ncbi:MAG: Cys-tRNA(Pro) deacylase [Tissierellia bacterium]|nr:Cys-tRNA(Pro) deacylase [Tissierellia bacterium]